VERAIADGCESLQVFNKSSAQWKAKTLSRAECVAFRAALDAAKLPVISHGSYLVNLRCPEGDALGAAERLRFPLRELLLKTAAIRSRPRWRAPPPAPVRPRSTRVPDLHGRMLPDTRRVRADTSAVRIPVDFPLARVLQHQGAMDAKTVGAGLRSESAESSRAGVGRRLRAFRRGAR